MNFTKRFALFLFATSLAFVMSGCYSFTGASIPPNVNTFFVDHFPNRATLVNPTLSADFSEELRSFISSRSSLKLGAEGEADIEISGEITTYTLTPMAAQADAQAALQRLTVAIRINLANNPNPKDSFTQTFSIHRDFDSSLDFSTIEDELVSEIMKEMVENIFMRAFGNW